MRGRDNDVIAGLAGQQLGLQRVVAVVDVIADLDAGFLLETGIVSGAVYSAQL